MSCGPAGKTAQAMWDNYREVLVWQGVAVDGSLIDLYAALPTAQGAATWTIIQTMHGRSCTRIKGPDWLIPEPPIGGPET